MYDPLIYSTATATMSAIQRYVSRGAVWYVTGEVEADRALALAARLDERYGLAATVAQRDHARRAKRATFRLILWPLSGTTRLRWWLLRTDGEHPLLSMERWRDARHDRIRWPWDFELAQMPVPPAARAGYRRKNGRVAINAVTWTWRIERQHMEAMRASIRHWAQHADERLAALIRSLHLSPGFRQIRTDVLTIDRYVLSQCERRKRTPPAIPPLPRPVIRAAGRQDQRVPLSALVRRRQRGASSWFPARLSSGTDTGMTRPTMETDHVAATSPEPDAPTLDDPAG